MKENYEKLPVRVSGDSSTRLKNSLQKIIEDLKANKELFSAKVYYDTLDKLDKKIPYKAFDSKEKPFIDLSIPDSILKGQDFNDIIKDLPKDSFLENIPYKTFKPGEKPTMDFSIPDSILKGQGFNDIIKDLPKDSLLDNVPYKAFTGEKPSMDFTDLIKRHLEKVKSVNNELVFDDLFKPTEKEQIATNKPIPRSSKLGI